MPYSLKGRKVLVTAGSRGLGAVICEKFADEGAHIMVNYVSREDRAAEVVQKVKQRGVEAFMVQGVSTNRLDRSSSNKAGCRSARRQCSHSEGDSGEIGRIGHHCGQCWLDSILKLQEPQCTAA